MVLELGGLLKIYGRILFVGLLLYLFYFSKKSRKKWEANCGKDIRQESSIRNVETIFGHLHEWRTVYPFGPNAKNEDRFIKVPCPKNLYVGSKASTENINRLREISENKKIPLYQLHLDEDSHKLHEQLIYSPPGY